ncbi:MAG: ethanolamine permease [Corynebacterium sp.]|nr:ethanolamine permease [Corynebacterium sp.]
MTLRHKPSLSTRTFAQNTQSSSPNVDTGLKAGSVGWILLAALGVAFVISGDFAGWQFGLERGGFGGMFIAVLIVAAMYYCMCLCLGELSAALPSAGGGYRFASVALGRTGGYVTAAAVLLEYVIAPAALPAFIAGYLSGIGLNPFETNWPIALICYGVFVGLHLCGAGEAMRVLLAMTALSMLALVVYCFYLLPHADLANFTDNGAAHNPTGFFPHGFVGIWAAFPFAIWFFLAVEGVPMAAEEAKNPAKDIPRAIKVSMGVLLCSALAMLIIGPAAATSGVIGASNNPLVDALHHIGAHSAVIKFISGAALLALITSFFSITYGYSRLIYSLARDKVLPDFLGRTNRRGAPTWALILPAILGLVLTVFFDGDTLMSVAVFGAVVSYALIMISFIVLRRNRPQLQRPYVAPGGVATAGFALAITCIAIVAVFISDWRVGLCGLLLLLAMTGWYKVQRQ